VGGGLDEEFARMGAAAGETAAVSGDGRLSATGFSSSTVGDATLCDIVTP